ncbi:PucR family transcriptional regulator [Nocardia cyriacigeorgica]|uniref:PucR family transcriptional regulator n=1 Tax=Nocardia cyriacigeorgica TaxID=135487 RepID=UPI00245404A1|nr:helix-turn-helix domain-containing protein [Nocardia cyriacigeorgica]
MIENAMRSGCQTPGRPISPAVHDVRRISRRLVDHLASSVPPFTTLRAEVMAGEVAAMVRACVEWSLQRMSGDDTPLPTDRIDAAAARWAKDGLPIDAVLHAFHAGFKAGLDLLFARTEPTGSDDIVEGATAALELLNQITSTVSKAYVREHKAGAAEHHTAVHTLTSALLGGHATSKMARECGIPIAAEYFVLAVSLPSHPDESHPRLDPHVVARRKLRRVQAALADRFGDVALSLLSVDGGTILVPATVCAENELDDMVRALSEAALVPIRATVLTAAADGVASAADRAHDLLDTVHQLGRAPGLYRFAELALHYQLTRPGIGRDILHARLAPLDDHPELMETLRVYFSMDLNRQRTARILHVHPNTVDYRLRRIGQLTGLDLSPTEGLWYLRSALIARVSGEGRADASLGARQPA